MRALGTNFESIDFGSTFAASGSIKGIWSGSKSPPCVPKPFSGKAKASFYLRAVVACMVPKIKITARVASL